MFPVNARRSVAESPDDFTGARPHGRAIRVFIIDGHEFVRRGLAALIDAEIDMECCGEVDGQIGVIDALARCKPDLVLVDVSPSRGRGLQLIQEIRTFDPRIRIMALAMYQRSDDMGRVFSAGAEACVRKLDAGLRVLQAIRRTYTARSPLADEPGVVRAPGPSNGAPAHRRGSQLDRTDREIVELIGRGLPARGIAVRLGLSVAVVEARRRRIRGKLNVPTATQLVEFCVHWVQQHGEDARAGR